MKAKITNIFTYKENKMTAGFERYWEIVKRINEIGNNLGCIVDENGQSLFLAAVQNKDAEQLLSKMRNKHADEYNEYLGLLDESEKLVKELGIDKIIESYENSPEYAEDMRKAREYMEAKRAGEDPVYPEYSDKYYEVQKLMRKMRLGEIGVVSNRNRK